MISTAGRIEFKDYMLIGYRGDVLCRGELRGGKVIVLLIIVHLYRSALGALLPEVGDAEYFQLHQIGGKVNTESNIGN